MPRISKYIYEELVNQIDADINSAQNELSNIIRDVMNKKANSWLKANEEGIRDSISINIDTSSVGYYNRPNTRITVRLDNSWNSDLDKSIKSIQQKLNNYYKQECDRFRKLKQEWIMKVINNQVEDVDISLPSIKVELPKDLLV